MVESLETFYLLHNGHIMRMDDNADAKRILLASPPADWSRQLGHSRITWLSTIQQDTGSETTPYVRRSSRFGSEPPSVEDDVNVWRYAIPQLHARNDHGDDGRWSIIEKVNSCISLQCKAHFALQRLILWCIL